MSPTLAAILLALLIPLGWLAWHRHERRQKKLRRQQKAAWSIGLYEGPDPVTLSPAKGITNPILTAQHVTDVPARFVADPFMLTHNGKHHLFFELLNTRRQKGEIGHAESRDLTRWHYTGVVLREKFHLSYPYVFEHDGAIYMLPECAKSKAIRLYRATAFPNQWEHAATLLQGGKREVPLLDPSIVHHNGHWYLFSYMRKANNLHLHLSDTLQGPWREHPMSPIVQGSPHYARPAGRIARDGQVLYRYAQDSKPRYGSKAWGFRITELTPKTYKEEAVSDEPVIQAGPENWHNRGMHTIDPQQQPDGRWIAVVDGLEHKLTTPS